MCLKKFGLFGLIVMMGLAVSACNTVQGIGEDLQQGGRAIQHAADK